MKLKGSVGKSIIVHRVVSQTRGRYFHVWRRKKTLEDPSRPFVWLPRPRASQSFPVGLSVRSFNVSLLVPVICRAFRISSQMVTIRLRGSGQQSMIPGHSRHMPPSSTEAEAQARQQNEMGIFFTKNGVYQGLAFRNVPPEVHPRAIQISHCRRSGIHSRACSRLFCRVHDADPSAHAPFSSSCP